MELGSLAEWVTGISELLAVSVALFLPYFSEKKKKKKISDKLIVVTHNMVLRVLQEKEDNPGKKIEKLKSYSDFRQYASIVSIINEDPLTLSELAESQELLLTVAKDNSNLTEVFDSLNF